MFEQLPWYFAKKKEQIWNHITLPGNDHISPLKVGKMRFFQNSIGFFTRSLNLFTFLDKSLASIWANDL